MSAPVPKRIVFVENGIGYGGAIICLRHLVRNLDTTEFSAMVVTGRDGPSYREIADETLWRHIPDRRFDIVGWRQRISDIEAIQNQPVLRVLCNQLLARADDIANFLPFFLALLWQAWRFKADLIHANNEPLCNRAALLVAKVLNVPAICHVRGDQQGSRSMRWAYSLPDHFVSVSHWVAASMRDKLKIPAEKISVIYDGIALDQLDTHADGAVFRRQYGIQSDQFVVGLIGLLIPWKGQHLFLDAAKRLQSRIPNLKMLIVGGTPDDCKGYEADLVSRVADEGLNATVSFTGHINKMETVYNGLDVIVSASTSPEPLGTVVIEALAMGRPLIGPAHGGAAEMIEHEKTGLLFRPGDAESLAEQIYRVYSDRQLGIRLGEQARTSALQRFSIRSHVAQVETVYRRLLAPRKQR
ncbi:glycosyltransferase family 4 protein [Methylomonas sp. MED-D]|uniref:glycosyltransferase family 4 protein n=1 Tax=unclassified Methylomonas TaxID=2608980 RepID=UPI0028A47D48|nr:glycosyltransferase family 4 protein [Methylomonas sp. MV1]MDT4328880.1 glycosyltransferase family 4 protein [Methylomonas sp. MV1]